MGPAESISSRPGKSLWIVKCPERFWYFPGSFDCASFRLWMILPSPLPLFRLWEGKTSGQSTFICFLEHFLRCFRSFFVFACGEGSAAGWFLPYRLRRAFSQYPVPGYSILHAGAFAARFACGGFGGIFPESSFFMYVPCCMAVFLKLAFGRILANLVTCNQASFLEAILPGLCSLAF